MMPSPLPDEEAVPAEDEEVVPPRKRSRVRTVLIGLLAVLLVGGGVAAADGYFGWYGGGGTHPYDVMPASTVAYLQLDLNPSLDQKTQAWAFLRDLPEVQEVTPGQPDPKRVLWSFKKWLWVGRTWTDYDRDVAPWLGDRIGVGIIVHDTEQIWVTAIRVTDEGKATAKIQEWLDATQNDYEVTTRDGYAIITAKSTASVVHAEQAKGLLGNNQRFMADLRSVGENGWMAGWLDFGALAASSPSPSDAGRTAFALRFSGDTLEFAGRVLGWKHPLVNGAGQLGALPASTGSAVCVSGSVTGRLPVPLLLPLPSVGDWWKSQYGLDEGDVAALLGQSVCVSAPSTAVKHLFSVPEVLGLRVVTDDPARAQQVLHKVAADIFDHQSLAVDRVDGNALSAATTKDYLAEIAGSAGKLSSQPSLTKAVPDSSRAALASYLNLEVIGPSYVDAGSPYEPFVKAMKALGVQYFDEGSGNGSWSVRIVRT